MGDRSGLLPRTFVVVAVVAHAALLSACAKQKQVPARAEGDSRAAPAPAHRATPGDLIGMDDPAGEPYKEAVRALLRAIIANDEAAARAAFVGTGDDLKLLELTLETNRAMARLRRLRADISPHDSAQRFRALKAQECRAERVMD